MTRYMLTKAQQRVIDNDDVGWVGWDAKGRPVVDAYYMDGYIQPRDDDKRSEKAELTMWAVTFNGSPSSPAEPVDKHPARGDEE